MAINKKWLLIKIKINMSLNARKMQASFKGE